jgi:hypothetical protein
MVRSLLRPPSITQGRCNVQLLATLRLLEKAVRRTYRLHSSLARVSAYFSKPVMPRSLPVTTPFSPLQLLSAPAHSQNCIMVPISRPQAGQRRSNSSSETCTYCVGLPVKSPQACSVSPSVVTSPLAARTNFPGSVSSGCLSMAAVKTPTVLRWSPTWTISVLEEELWSQTYLPAVC